MVCDDATRFARGLVFRVDDVAATHGELSAKGVEFSAPPEEEPWGTQAVLRDPDGNGIVLCSRLASSAPGRPTQAKRSA